MTEAIRRSPKRPNLPCLRELIGILGVVDGKAPRKKQDCAEAIVLHLLWVDMQPYQSQTSGLVKQCLSRKSLWAAAGVWIDCHCGTAFNAHKQILKNSSSYAEKWNNLKRFLLEECGLKVHVAERARVYFEAPHRRPSGPHTAPKSGDFFQPITTPSPYQRSGADDEDDDVRDKAKGRGYVRNATSEQSMGAGAVPEMEVPLPEDEDALLCPDRVTKCEWDAIRFAPDLVRRGAFAPTDVDISCVTEEQLKWFRRPSRGGASREEYAKALLQFPNPNATEE